MEEVVLVNELDEEIGVMEKIQAHREGVLHRAFSVLLFNAKGEVLLQKRAITKYHSGGLWTNTCCSHPHPDESMEHAVNRKLVQEMGIHVQPEFAFKFHYRTPLDHNLIENEIDYVFIGAFDGEPIVNADEVEEWRFTSMDQLHSDMKSNPGNYTYWFKVIAHHPALEIALS